jgi:hypothetical protein
MAPNFIEEFLQSGANVDITGVSYGPQFVTQWVQIAVATGAHLTIGPGYGPQFYQQWAKAGGRNVTFKIAGPQE